MSVELHFNQQRVAAARNSSLFDCAESLGIKVPTSCQKQGKCKECMVEIVEGMDLLTPRTEHEEHLKDRFRLSCRAQVLPGDGQVRCHTMRRGQMRIERHAYELPLSHHKIQPDPAVTRDGDRILIDGHEVDRSSGPLHGIAMDLGTTTIVLRLLNLETGELVADASLEN